MAVAGCAAGPGSRLRDLAGDGALRFPRRGCALLSACRPFRPSGSFDSSVTRLRPARAAVETGAATAECRSEQWMIRKERSERTGTDAFQTRGRATRGGRDALRLAWRTLNMIVDETLVLQIKATERLHPRATRQLFGYLCATNLEVSLWLHVGREPRSLA
jgi:hypothetical protein